MVATALCFALISHITKGNLSAFLLLLLYQVGARLGPAPKEIGWFFCVFQLWSHFVPFSYFLLLAPKSIEEVVAGTEAITPLHTDAFLRNLVQTSKDKQNDAIFINFHDQFDHNFEAFLPLFATT